MENLKMQKEIINLGKLFVKELNLERGNNTFPRWVAHYIAELIHKSQSTKGDEKLKVQKECLDAILKLWKHRWVLPNGRRPLENFEPILNLLQKLNPEKEDPYFFPIIPTKFKSQKEGNPKVGSTQFWVEVAEQIDKVSRIWLSDILKLAGETALEGQDKEWLVNSVNVPENDDRRVIQFVLREDTLEQQNSTEEIIDNIDYERKFTIEKHRYRIELLERYVKLNEFLIEHHQFELNKLEKIDSAIAKNTLKKKVAKKDASRNSPEKKK